MHAQRLKIYRSSLFLSLFSTTFLFHSTWTTQATNKALIIKLLSMLLFYIWSCRNMYSFQLFGYDKYCAMQQKYRVSENELIASSSKMGWIGAILGMMIFTHKIQKIHFLVKIAEEAALSFVLVIILLLARNYVESVY